ncbi:Copper transport protein CTR2 [Curvularia clavata]|uniref:Copper transport protein n=1 Tax=Curvularia clavata TaxID=95742 RepID=A0A9Q8ZAI1_CURCL|nr:Copper transport protein CTR2 [Curvularia clavata]
MDHSHMDHGHMDHGHMDHGHMDHDMPGMGGSGPKCIYAPPKDDGQTNESSSLLGPGRNGSLGRSTEQQMKIIKAVLYAVQVFYSFFIMLLFMTYNGWIMLAVAVGAFVGYLMFSQSSSTKSVACH